MIGVVEYRNRGTSLVREGDYGYDIETPMVQDDHVGGLSRQCSQAVRTLQYARFVQLEDLAPGFAYRILEPRRDRGVGLIREGKRMTRAFIQVYPIPDRTRVAADTLGACRNVQDSPLALIIELGFYGPSDLRSLGVVDPRSDLEQHILDRAVGETPRVPCDRQFCYPLNTV
jgi:hypothetical protein